MSVYIFKIEFNFLLMLGESLKNLKTFTMIQEKLFSWNKSYIAIWHVI